MGERPGGGDVVHRHDVDLRASLLGGSEEVPSDPSKAVDPDLERHARALLRFVGCRPREASILVPDLIRPSGAEGPRPPHSLVRSRCSTETFWPRLRKYSARSSVTTTDRCFPPVQPMPMVRYDFPSDTYPGTTASSSPLSFRMNSP